MCAGEYREEHISIHYRVHSVFLWTLALVAVSYRRLMCMHNPPHLREEIPETYSQDIHVELYYTEKEFSQVLTKTDRRQGAARAPAI